MMSPIKTQVPLLKDILGPGSFLERRSSSLLSGLLVHLHSRCFRNVCIWLNTDISLQTLQGGTESLRLFPVALIQYTFNSLH